MVQAKITLGTRVILDNTREFQQLKDRDIDKYNLPFNNN